ncbi:MAG: hypothetical protein QXL94_00530 [Candidatus Parvarchaeum sp.]
MTACQLETLSLKGSGNDLATYEVSWAGNPASTDVTGPSTSYTGDHAAPSWSTEILINNNPVTTAIDWSLEFNRAVTPIPALTGTQEYLEYFSQSLDISGKFTFVEQAGSPYLSAFLGGSQATIDIRCYDIFSGNLLRWHASTVFYTTGSLERGSEYVQVPISFNPIPSTLDSVPGTSNGGGMGYSILEVANNITTAYYA